MPDSPEDMEARYRYQSQAKLCINFFFLEFDEINPDVSAKFHLMGFPQFIFEQLPFKSRHIRK